MPSEPTDLPAFTAPYAADDGAIRRDEVEDLCGGRGRGGRPRALLLLVHMIVYCRTRAY